ncbi:hypothetical protein Ahy_B09g096095 isoform B [Arachis hypogaea]|uniref:WAT1-related protein n=1 Tax=Arachis hypogaea TaxID=3818 RepID=A0A444XII1_ARAHY|nr:hypothetical protein Ahy_B09g096095 isoform B [Arachis hypogaea]
MVGVTIISSIWVLWMKEASSGMSQLWTSCWKGVHPLCLLFTRFSSLLIMAVLVSMDVLDYDASIFFYYTEYVI